MKKRRKNLRARKRRARKAALNLFKRQDILLDLAPVEDQELQIFVWSGTFLGIDLAYRKTTYNLQRITGFEGSLFIIDELLNYPLTPSQS